MGQCPVAVPPEGGGDKEIDEIGVTGASGVSKTTRVVVEDWIAGSESSMAGRGVLRHHRAGAQGGVTAVAVKIALGCKRCGSASAADRDAMTDSTKTEDGKATRGELSPTGGVNSLGVGPGGVKYSGSVLGGVK